MGWLQVKCRLHCTVTNPPPKTCRLDLLWNRINQSNCLWKMFNPGMVRHWCVYCCQWKCYVHSQLCGNHSMYCTWTELAHSVVCVCGWGNSGIDVVSVISNIVMCNSDSGKICSQTTKYWTTLNIMAMYVHRIHMYVCMYMYVYVYAVYAYMVHLWPLSFDTVAGPPDTNAATYSTALVPNDCHSPC